jgi:hypothetical protein
MARNAVPRRIRDYKRANRLIARRPAVSLHTYTDVRNNFLHLLDISSRLFKIFVTYTQTVASSL